MGNKACALPCMNTHHAEVETYDVRGMTTGHKRHKQLHDRLVPEARQSGIYSQLIDRERFIEHCGNKIKVDKN